MVEGRAKQAASSAQKIRQDFLHNFTDCRFRDFKNPKKSWVAITMPQNEYIERWQKLHGKRLDHDERERKKLAREGHHASEKAQNLRGFRAKMYQQKRHKEKIQMKKQIKAHEERNVKSSAADENTQTPIPNYLLDRGKETNT